jgi:hypothetical protein
MSEVNLDNCADEPIHIPGAIQPHGVLFVYREDDLEVLQVSESVGAILGVRPADVLGAPLTDLSIRPTPRASLGIAAFDPRLRTAIAKLSSTEIAAISQAAADEVRALTGFDRVIVYAFDADWNGEVLAESRREDLDLVPRPALSGLRHPGPGAAPLRAQLAPPHRRRRLHASPMIARKEESASRPLDKRGEESASRPLDKRGEESASRPLDKRGEESASRPLDKRGEESASRPLDMSFATLRSVSPMHIEYLKNMGQLIAMLRPRTPAPRIGPARSRPASRPTSRSPSTATSSSR